MKLRKLAVLMTSSFFATLLVAVFSFEVTARAESLGFSFSSGDATQGMHVTVVDELTGTPVVNAQVTLSGPATGDAQTVMTSATGNAVVKWPAGAPATLAVNANGYASLSVIGATAANANVQLKTLSTTSGTVLASGTMGSFAGLTELPTFSDAFNALNLGESVPQNAAQPMSFLGKIKFGLVIHSISSFDLLNFAVSSFVSPLNDTINVQGSHNIPSNLVLPPQSLLFGTIKLNKPNYRLPVTKNKPLILSGLQGTVEASSLTGSVGISVINKLTLTRAAIDASHTPTADFTETVNGSFALSPQYSVTAAAPPFNADVLVASAADINGDGSAFVPTDAKLAAAAGTSPSGSVSLKAATGATRVRDVVFAVAMSDNGRRISGVLNAANPNVTFASFLNADLNADQQPLPPNIAVTPASQGIGAVVFGDANGTFQYVYVLPSAAQATLNTKTVLNGHAATTYSQVQLQFSNNFDQNNFEGRTALQSLSKFTRVQTGVAP